MRQQTHRAAVITGVGRVEIIERPTPTALRPGHALVRVLQTGICGGEISTFTGANGKSYDDNIGHEFFGELVAVGEPLEIPEPSWPFVDWAARAQVGDLVVGWVRGKAMGEYALSWQHTLLPVGRMGSRAYPSVLGEPAMCTASAITKAGVGMADHVLVLGAGPMALTLVAQLSKMGCATITVAARRNDGRRAAREAGAKNTIALDSLEQLEHDVRRITGDAADITFEATGAEDPLSWAYSLTRASGRLSVLSYHEGQRPSTDLGVVELRAVEQSSGHTRDLGEIMRSFERSVRLTNTYGITLDWMVTHTAGLDGVQGLFEAAADRTSTGCIKAVVELT